MQRVLYINMSMCSLSHIDKLFFMDYYTGC